MDFRIHCTDSNQGGVKCISGGTGNLWAMGQRLGSDSVLQELVRALEDRVSKEMLKFFGGGLRAGHRRMGVGLVFLGGGVWSLGGGVCIAQGAAKAPRWPVRASGSRLPACARPGVSQKGGKEAESLGQTTSTPFGEPSQPPQTASLRRLLHACDSWAARDRGAGGSFELRGSGLPARRGAGAQVSEVVGWNPENPRSLGAKELGSRESCRRGEQRRDSPRSNRLVVGCAVDSGWRVSR